MKRSSRFVTFVPTALAIATVVNCAHGNSISSKQLALHPLVGITAEDIERAPNVPIEQLLVARVPGLYITRARDGHSVMHLRGVTSLSDEEPLYVVNGVPLGDPTNFSAINRSDIATIEVLRDPMTTAMYGIRGANGVIVVRTKGS